MANLILVSYEPASYKHICSELEGINKLDFFNDNLGAKRILQSVADVLTNL